MWLQVCTCLALLAVCMAAGGKQGILAGAPVSSEETGYLDFAVKNVRKFFSDNRDDLPESIKLIGSTAQVVAGIRYEYYFLVSSPNNQSQFEICHGSVWVRPWLTKNYITQLDNPVKCEFPRSALDAMEKMANDQSNSLYYVQISGEPTITTEGSDIKVADVPLSKTSCTKDDVSNGASCTVEEDAKPLQRCSATLVWTGTQFGVKDFTVGNY